MIDKFRLPVKTLETLLSGTKIRKDKKKSIMD